MALGWRQITAQFGAPQLRRRRAARARCASARSATASSAAWSSATPRTWTWCSCTTRAASARRPRGAQADRQPAVLRAPGAAHRAPAHHALRRRPALRGRRAAAPERQGRPAGHQHRGVRRVPARGSLDLGAPGAAARARRGRRGRSCARASRPCASRCCATTCGASACARRCATCASACGASCRKGDATQLRHQAGRRRHRRHRVPGAVLGAALGRDYPPVALFSDTIRQLESVASADLVPQASVDVLTGAYRAYRARTHRLSLDGAPPIVPASEFRGTRAAVTGALGCHDERWRVSGAGIIAASSPPADESHGRDGQAADTAERAEPVRGRPPRTCRCPARCRRCTCGTRTRGCTCRSRTPAGPSAPTAAPSTRCGAEPLRSLTPRRRRSGPAAAPGPRAAAPAARPSAAG